MKIAILVEGKTEKAFKPHLQNFLQTRLAGNMPKLDIYPYDGRIPKEDKLARVVANLLLTGNPPADAVIALTDVYTGTREFTDAIDAKEKMSRWAGHKKFYPHVALHDFECWLLPYWEDIQRIAGHNRNAPPGQPENVNHNHPPSYHVKEIFRLGTCRDDYSKPRDANRILRGKDLALSASKCPELKEFLNRIITLSGGSAL